MMNIQTTWTDADWDKFNVWLKSILLTEIVTVTFTKKDGTDRVMKCSLSPEQLPPITVVEGKKERKTNKDVLAVYDVEAAGWRSFTLKSVKKVEFVIC